MISVRYEKRGPGYHGRERMSWQDRKYEENLRETNPFKIFEEENTYCQIASDKT